MAQDYDAIIIGGGHNGLTCGAYLAKAGLALLEAGADRLGASASVAIVQGGPGSA